MAARPGDYVLIRTRDAGVNFGKLVERDRENNCVVLKDARLIWSWEGAFTTYGIAEYGLESAVITCQASQEVEIAGVAKIFTLSEEVKNKLYAIPEHQPQAHQN